MLLNGKVAVVTGAGSGIGQAICQKFSHEGARVVATSRNAQTLAEQYCGNDSVVTLATDIAAPDAPQRLVDEALQAFGGLDIVVNAAGAFEMVELETCPHEVWERMLAVNLTAPFHLCLKAVPALKQSGAGRIINIASVSTQRAKPGMGPYAVSKHGLVGLTASLAMELGKYGITANAISPGAILTGMTRPLMENPEWKHELERLSVLERVGLPEEIAQAALYLAGPNSGFTTGQVLTVDGGYSA